ncbi:MAG: acetyl-CoA carboxylase biotin carboxyl carrier protein subunit [Leptospira sp.]|nr:acetyl-CoA carboxylase biotin carboxyl carrier protein subunit [Leptospira sp.]
MNFHFEAKERSISVTLDGQYVRVIQGKQIEEFDINKLIKRPLEAFEKTDSAGIPRTFHLVDGNKLTVLQVRNEIFLHANGETWSRKLYEKDFSIGGDNSPEIKSPMPGKVVQLLCEVGKEYKHGEGLIVLEAMKMENVIKSPYTSRVLECKKAVGEIVGQDDVLLVLQRIEPEMT